MKKIFNQITLFNTIVAFIATMAYIAVFSLGWGQKTITLPLWIFFIILSIPHIIFVLFRMIWYRQKRKFKTGDRVNIIADEREFVVVRYHSFAPLYAICKEVNKSSALSVHQKYLTPFKKNEKHSINDMLNFSRNINKDVPTITIRKL